MQVWLSARRWRWLLMCAMSCAAGCSSDSAQPNGPNGGGGVDAGENSKSAQGMAQHRPTLHQLADDLFAAITIVGELEPAPDATTEQQEAFRKALNGYRISGLKSGLLEYDVWMDSLDANQARGLDQKAAELDAWIDEVRACYPFSAEGTVQQLTPLVNQLEQRNDTLRAALSKVQ